MSSPDRSTDDTHGDNTRHDGECLGAALLHIQELLAGRRAPDLPEELENNTQLRELRGNILILRSILENFSRGDLSGDIPLPGFCGGALKSLQAHLRHLTWQVQQVEQGDLTQRVDFLGDFSVAFNKMIERLDSTMTQLRQKEAALTLLASSLRTEVEQRSAAVQALRQSESKFKYLAEHDALTGILNRRSFVAHAMGAMHSAATLNSPFAVGLLDVDKFKNFNDTYGHLAGDEALRHLVRVAQSQLRQEDMIGRYGGEEFILSFSGTDMLRGTAVAERIRKAVAGTPLAFEGKEITVTCSIGLCTVLPECSGERDEFFLQAVINQADAALYAAKNRGRNQVVAVPFSPPGQNAT